MKRRIVAIIQARLSSSRLPGKVMLDLAGKPAIQRVYEQLAFSKLIDDIVIAHQLTLLMILLCNGRLGITLNAKEDH